MSNPYLVEAKCMILVHADDPDAAADLAISDLENTAFDISIISTKPW
jgi:hypothetical protein